MDHTSGFVFSDDSDDGNDDENENENGDENENEKIHFDVDTVLVDDVDGDENEDEDEDDGGVGSIGIPIRKILEWKANNEGPFAPSGGTSGRIFTIPSPDEDEDDDTEDELASEWKCANCGEWNRKTIGMTGPGERQCPECLHRGPHDGRRDAD